MGKKIINLFLATLSRKFRLSDILHEPTHLQIELTNRCNLFCIECYRNKFLTAGRKVGDLSYGDFKKLFLKLPSSVTNISLFGAGESLLNKDFLQIVDYILSNRNAKIFLTTNATLIDLKLAKELKDRNVHIQISLNSSSDEAFKRFCRCDGNLFYKAIDGIESLSIAGYKPAVTIVMLNENINELVQFVEFSHKHGVKSICFGEQNYSGTENARNTKIKDIEKYKKNLTLAINRAKELGVSYSHAPLYKDVWGKSLAFQPCNVLWKMPYITWDGYVTPCCSRPIPEIFHLGNLFTQDFKQVWFGDEYKKLRIQVLRGVSDSICKNCQHLSVDSYPE